MGVTRDQVISDLLASLVATILVAASAFIVSPFLPARWAPFVPIVASAVGFFVVLLVLHAPRLNPASALGNIRLRRVLGVHTVYDSLEAAKTDLVQAFNNAQRIDMLVYRGLNMFGTNGGMFYKVVQTRLRSTTPPRVRVLQISPDAPAFSEEQVALLDKDRDTLLDELEGVRKFLIGLKEKYRALEYRQHHEPFIWRLFIFVGEYQTEMFVSGYIRETGNDESSPVLRIVKPANEADNSLFPVFQKYFDHLWETYPPTAR